MSAAPLATTPPPLHSAADMPATWPDALRMFSRHASPRLLAALLAVAVVARITLGDAPGLADLAVVAGYAVLWSFQEWLIHVFVLHWKPVTVFGRTLDFRVPRKHRAHHRDPWHAELIFIPFHTFLYTVPVLFGLWLALAPSLSLALTGLTLHLALSLHYEWVHFFVHTRVVPTSWLYKRLWTNHRLHHFRNEHYWFGVTMLSADHVLRTQPERDAVPASPTARDLLGEGAA
jgi:hypothetical protein